MIAKTIRVLSATLPLALLAACAAGPDYVRPPAPVPAAYKELQGWRPAEPKEAASGSPWWSIYDDPVLDGLERQIDVSNQNLKAAEAAYRQSRALVAEARASFFPTLTANGSAERLKQGGGSAFSSRSARARTQYDLTANASWEADVWGRIRRTVESNEANAQASAADLASARLSAQATLALDYFQLRIDDQIKRLLDDTVAAFQRSLQIARNRYAAGVVSRSDVAQAQAQLENARSQAVGIGVQRAELEHAIAVLMGKPPAGFSVAPAPLRAEVPVVPAGVPSTLLERRPDIASAERLMAAANAEVGVAQSAYFPTLTLSAAFGYTGPTIANLLETPNRAWSLGPQLLATLFDGGLRSAQVEAARAAYDRQVATYRQTVLNGFQQVEDNLSTLRILQQQADVQEGAVRAAQVAEQLALNQYLAGTVDYTTVVTAQATSLSAQQAALSILQTRLGASVTLIEALGGGWSTSQLPDMASAPSGSAATPTPAAVR